MIVCVCKNLNESDIQKKFLEEYKNFDEVMREWGIGGECKVCLATIKSTYESIKGV
ncbi:MAG TPA: hypothetical protein DHN29_04760 [Cytophagales bacterium]|nr:hypothetical protein [Cytophagales bacterium]|tara:strand:- start:1576 stop:1743 length:168 start_codon:yes stop_codon:yes gene_type:complete